MSQNWSIFFLSVRVFQLNLRKIDYANSQIRGNIPSDPVEVSESRQARFAREVTLK